LQAPSPMTFDSVKTNFETDVHKHLSNNKPRLAMPSLSSRQSCNVPPWDRTRSMRCPMRTSRPCRPSSGNTHVAHHLQGIRSHHHSCASAIENTILLIILSTLQHKWWRSSGLAQSSLARAKAVMGGASCHCGPTLKRRCAALEHHTRRSKWRCII